MAKERTVGFFVRWKPHLPFLKYMLEMGASPVVLANAEYLQPDDFTASGLGHDPIFLDYGAHPRDVSAHICAEIRRRGLKLERLINIDDLATDYYLTAAPALGLTDPELEAYRRCRVKPMARQRLLEKGVDTNWFHTVPRPLLPNAHATSSGMVIPAEGREIILPFPFVMKPATGAASRAVVVIRTAEDYKAALPRQIAFHTDWHDFEIAGYHVYRDVLIEQGLEGMEVEVNGYAAGGHVRNCAFGGKFTAHDSHGIKEMGGFLVRPEPEGHASDFDRGIRSWTASIADALEYHNGVFHLEGFYTPERDFHMLEFNPRMGGGGTLEMVLQMSGVNLVREFVRSHLKAGQPVEPRETDTSSLIFIWLYADRPGRVAGMRPMGPLQVPFGGRMLNATWEPIVSPGLVIEDDDLDMEIYLGRLQVINLDRNTYNYGAVIEELYHWLKRQGFARIESR